MSLFWIAFIVCALFLAAYFSYGRFLGRFFDLRAERKTPACEMNDGVDYVPAKKRFLLSQHFSAIAAAGPIAGPILAGLWFGWLPVLLWIVGGTILLGAVHDFSALVGSVKHRATSIVEIVKIYLGPTGHLVFLIFVWFSLIYVITAFTDLTSSSFAEPKLGGAVASSSALYLIIGLVMGVALYKFKMPLGIATLIFLPLVVLSIWLGQYIPLRLPDNFPIAPQQAWNTIILAYCFIASLIPVWLLLQPRGYLGGFFLYGTLIAGVVGLFLGKETVQYPAFIGFESAKGLPLFPLLFVTVACGACSGFHGIVCSGTTSKQIAKEPDCQAVGYGGMLLEGLVALISLATVMILAQGSPLTSATPDRIYAEGLSRFVQHFGIPKDFALAFALLAFTTFIYDTLDVATRLARYILQELTGWNGWLGKVVATVGSVAVPLYCVSLKMVDPSGALVPAWKVFWTIFGTSNQLLAGLTFMILSVWLYRSGKPIWISVIPMIFLILMTLWSLGFLMKPMALTLFSGGASVDIIGVFALILFILAFFMLVEAFKVFRRESERVRRD